MPNRGLYPWRLRRADIPGRPPVVFPFVSTSVKKRKAAATPGPGDGPKHLAPIDTKLLASFPNLILFTSVVRYDDGDPRTPGWFQVKTDGSAWKVILKEPDTLSQMTLLGNTLDDAFTLAEMYAASDDAPWEPDLWARKNATKKKT